MLSILDMSIGEVSLTTPSLRKKLSLYQTLLCLSKRSPIFHDKISREDLSRIILHIQGCRGKYFKTIPSAGATYPIEVYIASSGNIFPLPKGLYRYIPCRGKLVQIAREDVAEDYLLIAAVYERTIRVYGPRGYMYVREEVGHLLQNLVLSLVSHGLYYEYTLEPDVKVPKGKPEVQVNIYRADRVCSKELEGESLDEIIVRRSSIRSFQKRPLSLRKIIDVLKWSLQESLNEYFTVFGSKASSISLYVVVANVEGLEEGIYHFNADRGSLELVKRGSFSRKLYESVLMQDCILKAPANIVIVGNHDELVDYIAGAVGQNIYLNSTAQGLGTVAVGAFYDEEVADVLGTDMRPRYVMPIGVPLVSLERIEYRV